MGSIGAILQPGADLVAQLCQQARAAGRLVTFDPNVRPALIGDPNDAVAAIERVVSLSDIVKLSDEDAAWLSEQLRQSPEALIDRWLHRGPSLVILTQGAAGSSAHSQDWTITADAKPVNVVDTVGAGDTYMGGLLDQLVHETATPGWAPDESFGRRLLSRAAQLAAVTVSREGADPPWARELATRPT